MLFHRSTRRPFLGALTVILIGLGIGAASTRLLPAPEVDRPDESAGGWSPISGEPSDEKPRGAADPVRADSAGKRALLIGVTKYDNLAVSSHLSGPANDAKLMRTTLIERFGFPAENIVSLTEDEGKPELRPTRANIAREFERLAEAAKAGDQIVVLMAGHGDRQPESNPPDPVAPEVDGIDEIFLPADVKPWKGFPDRVPNAIADKQIRDWLGAITAKKAYVWAIFDCCHSLSMSRDPSEPTRQLPPGVLVPNEELVKARERAGKRAGRDPGLSAKPAALTPSATNDYLVATFACREFETTPECSLPADSVKAKYHGLLTYSLVSGLEKSAVSGTPLTYRELMQQVQASYLARPQGAPTPTIDGAGQDRVVLGATKPIRPKITLVKIKDDYVVNVGDLHGITAGSVLRVYSPAGEKEKPRVLGHVQVEQARPLDSVVVAVAYEDTPKPAQLPATGLCEVVAVDYSLSSLRIGIESAKKEQDELKKQVADALRTLPKEEAGLFQLVDSAPHFVVRLSPSGPELQVASGNRLPISLPALDSEQFGPVLMKKLKAIHCARGLIAAGTHLESERSRGPSGDIKIEVISHVKNDEGQEIERVMERPATGYMFKTGDRISLRITNTSKTKRLEVTLLIVDSDYKITLIYPPKNEINKALEPGGMIKTSTTTFKNKPPFGPEQMVAIITAPTNPPVDYALLTQPGVQGRGNTGKSPVGQLLDRSMHGIGSRSSMAMSELEEQGARVLSWRTEPSPKK